MKVAASVLAQIAATNAFFWNKSSIDQLNALLKAGKPEVA
jgi:hypothetical protein